MNYTLCPHHGEERRPGSHNRVVDHDIATGVRPDMIEHGWTTDAWLALGSATITARCTSTGQSFTAPPHRNRGVWV